MFGFGKPPEKCQECEKLRLEFSKLRVDVEELADKVYHWMKRHEQRARSAAAGAAQESTAASGEDGTPAAPERNERIRRLIERRARGTSAAAG